ncbi:MAG TPA: SGNH/GDSL hydrolase family protein, partial [Pyrinomonadaceae bacterium]|nr:SGNH/GDSL hydrolase family protein [Pyrinomonadaceae bacterium]
GAWPRWVPASWRGYAAMDPRCYFSTTWWRKAKQQTLDTTKQKTRLNLLARSAGKPLMDQDEFVGHLTTLLRSVRELNSRVLLLGLLSVDEECFPGSPTHFESVNAKLRDTANAEGVEFFDWATQLKGARNSFFYRDSFHPNLAGANALAQALSSYLFK